MRIEIEGFRGCMALGFDAIDRGVVYLTGPNTSGKSSAIYGIGAVLSRDANPMRLSAAQFKRYKHREHDGDTSVSLHQGDDALYWFPESGYREPSGEWPHPSQPPAISSLFDFTVRSLPTKEISDLWDTLYMPPPAEVREKILEDLKGLVSKKRAKELADMIEKSGWKHVEGIYNAHRLEYQREWSKITGQGWGKKKAMEWRPDGWSAKLEDMTVERANELVGFARADYQHVCSADAVSAEMHKQAQEAREKVDELMRDKTAHEEQRPPLPDTAKRDEHLNRVNQAKRELERHKANQPKMPDLHACPHCSKKLVLEDGVPIDGESQERIFQENVAQWDDKRKQLESSVEDAEKAYDDFGKSYRKVAEKYKEWSDRGVSMNAEIQTYQGMAVKADAKVMTEADRYAVEKARQTELDARDDENRVKRLKDANKARQNAFEYGHMASLVGPKGMRYKLVSEGIERLNEVLKSISELTGWPLVHFNSKSNVEYGVDSLGFCSETERLIGQACIQTAMAMERVETAKKDKKPIPQEYVVVDSLDKMDDSFATQFATLVRYGTQKGLSYILASTRTATHVQEALSSVMGDDFEVVELEKAS